ncbi:hypothetical protein FHS89_002834 [Rubricella aquisinus]|uniref:Peptidase inhibitor I78 family protein n=1 Tax=Rubricella aquisinus TaxID=2028108 RepID=A0A840WSZ5_9RHOB|nr:I78 family peptidase inhibitor [Rubricella aquisinus]MBB5516792.1 hypothetical protein [Rubricella aquisinus]
MTAMRRLTALSLTCLLTVAACTVEEVTEKPCDADCVKEQSACGAADYAGLIGSNIAAVTLPATLNTRIIGPGMAVTMDYVPTRLNIETDGNGVIIRLYCG